MLAIGAIAPDFSLRSHTGRTVRLSDFRGKKNVVLAFHPLAFTPVCGVQMQAYEQAQPALAALGVEVLGISLDATPSKAAWAASLGGLTFELLSDFHPHGKVSAEYGVLREDGIPDRSIFVVDKAGTIAWSKLHQIPEQPDLAELMAVLSALASR